MPRPKSATAKNREEMPKVARLLTSRVNDILRTASMSRVLVVGDVMLDQFIYGGAHRISPEAPVPEVDFEHQISMPGGAGNVARNLKSLKTRPKIIGITGADEAAEDLKYLLQENGIDASGLASIPSRKTTQKTRIIADRQQLVRIDRETRDPVGELETKILIELVKSRIHNVKAVILSDYGKGVISKSLFDEVKRLCHENGTWLSIDPKFAHHIDLNGLSLMKPNRKTAFELARIQDDTKNPDPMKDVSLIKATEKLMDEFKPKILMVTLGEHGMLIKEKGKRTIHLPTAAQEIFDVSGAGDTTIAAFTMAINGGATPTEAAILSNHAAGIVVGKIGTATVTPEELLKSFRRK